MKIYPNIEIQFTEDIINGLTPITLGYKEMIKLDWQIQKEKQKIGEYNSQRTTLDFGGRKWIAWFCSDIPFNDSPYKFHGLPGLIIKVEDDKNNYSFTLKGNKKIYKPIENSLINTFTNGSVKIVEKEKFIKAFKNYKQDPLAAMRSELSPQILSMNMPGTDMKVQDFVDKQGREMQESYKLNDNPIEKE